MDAFTKLYDDLATRKGEANAVGPYAGGNGRIDRAAELINKLGWTGHLLDVGGATGNLGYALRDRFDRRYTIDISNACREPAISKGNIFLCANVDTDGLQLFEDTVDLVVALDFIEHILDPERFARECFRVLRPGGRVLINTPNIQYWRHLHDLVINGIFPHTSGDPEVFHGGHVAFYNERDMEYIFTSAGFIDCATHVDGLRADPPPPIWTTISRVPAAQMSYADLIFSCRKPS